MNVRIRAATMTKESRTDFAVQQQARLVVGLGYTLVFQERVL